MAITHESLEKYAAMEHMMPLDAQGIGIVSDNEHTVMLGFKTHREIITDIGYFCSDAGSTVLHACMNALCEHMNGQPTIAANTPQVSILSGILCDASGFSEEEEKFAMMAELSLKYAAKNYAMAAADTSAGAN